MNGFVRYASGPNADDRQRRPAAARLARRLEVGGRGGLEHEQLGLGERRLSGPDGRRLVPEAVEHDREQLPDVRGGFAEKDPCHGDLFSSVHRRRKDEANAYERRMNPARAR